MEWFCERASGRASFQRVSGRAFKRISGRTFFEMAFGRATSESPSGSTSFESASFERVFGWLFLEGLHRGLLKGILGGIVLKVF